MVQQEKIIQTALLESVQQKPSVKRGDALNNTLWWTETSRGPLLPPEGTREREWSLHQYATHDYNTLFKSGVAVTTKRVISTPWELSGPTAWTELYQDILWNACFGAGWDTFISKLVKDFTRYDNGAFVELVGRGDADGALVGNPTNINILDSLRCYATGDPIYPVIYMDRDGTLHVIHFTRIKRMVDMPDSYETSYEVGECALTRCIAPVHRDILMNRYVELSLDDNPPPGLMIFRGIKEKQMQAAFDVLDRDRHTDFGSKWGNVVRLYALQPDQEVDVTSIPYNTPPDKFDYVAYKELNVKEVALGLGVDIQDLWELTGNNLGTATQSEVLERKSKGQLLGTLYKSIERLINQMIPEELTFEFKYRDPEEDQQLADKANTWAGIVLSLEGKLTPDEQRRLLANQVEAIRDVITDESGRIIRLDDSDPETPEQAAPQLQVPPEAQQQPTQDVVIDDTTEAQKVLSSTQNLFRKQFIDLAMQVQNKALSPVVLKPALRLALLEAGADVLLDGYADGGSPMASLNEEAQKVLSVWRAEQSPFLRKFADELFDKPFTYEQLQRRAELWINKSLNPLYFKGLELANANKRFMWVVNPIKEHCVSCLKLNGQVHRMKDYTRTGLLPQSNKLVCGGFDCGCDLKPTDQPVRGRLRSVRYVRREHAHGKGYNPNQPRDEGGRFGSGGSGGSSLGDVLGGGESGGDTGGGKRNYQKFSQEDYDKWDKGLYAVETESNAGYKQIEAARAYTGDEYKDINGSLRGTSDKEPSEQVKRHTEDLKALTDRRMLDKDIVTYRADTGKGLPNGGDLSDDEFKSLAGSTIHDKGFTSTSVENEHLGEYGDVQYEIRVPAGSRGAYLEPVSKYAEEREFLIGEGTNYKVVEAHTGKPRKLVLEVQPDA